LEKPVSSLTGFFLVCGWAFFVAIPVSVIAAICGLQISS